MNNPNVVFLAVALAMNVALLIFLLLLLKPVRLWGQALRGNTRVSLLDIIGMKLRGCPPQLIVHAMIALTQRGVKVTAQEAQRYYLAAVSRGERIDTAAELADLIEDARRSDYDSPQT